MKYPKAIYSLYVLLVMIFASETAWGQSDDCIPAKPQYQTSVYDYSALLSQEQKATLETMLVTYSDSTSTQIVVAIKDDLCGNDISMLAVNWAHEWGIGQDGKDNGVFILLSPAERKIFIATGYGVEGMLTDAMTRRIIEQRILPYFRKGDYYSGLVSGVNAVFQVLTGQFKADAQEDDVSPLVALLPLIIFIVIVIALISATSNKGGNGTDNHRGGGRGGMNSDEAFLMGMLLGGMGRSSSGGYSSGGFGGGFGGGGFSGGFGGGGFGGGGAGGSW